MIWRKVIETASKKDKFAKLSDVLAMMETSNNYNGGSDNEKKKKKTPNKGKVLFLAKQWLLVLQTENHAGSDEVNRLGRSLQVRQRTRAAADAVYAAVILV